MKIGMRKTHQSKTKIVRALIIVLALLFLSEMAIEERVEAHIIVSKYIFPYLVLGERLSIDEKMATARCDCVT
jgi:uncharacterized membrane protein